GRTFDGVFVHDAVDYMLDEDDLRRAIATAYAHCRPGGVAVFLPDHLRETFEASTDHGGTDGPDGRGIRYLEWTTGPTEADPCARTEYACLVREADGTVRVAHETHRHGVFGRADWLRLLAEAGFEPEVVEEVSSEERTPRQCFVAHRPPQPRPA